MMRGEIGLPRPRLLVFAIFSSQIFVCSMRWARRAWTASDLLSSASIFVMRRRRRCCTGSQWRCRAQLQCSVEAIAEMPLRCAAESETLRRPAVRRCSLEPRRFLAQSKVRLMA